MKNTKFYIEAPAWDDRADIYLRGKTDDGRVIYFLPVLPEIGNPDSDAVRPDPTITLRGDDVKQGLQSLMDELWRLGYRPADIGTAGHLAATQAHLKDFRAIVAKKLGVELP